MDVNFYKTFADRLHKEIEEKGNGKDIGQSSETAESPNRMIQAYKEWDAADKKMQDTLLELFPEETEEK